MVNILNASSIFVSRGKGVFCIGLVETQEFLPIVRMIIQVRALHLATCLILVINCLRLIWHCLELLLIMLVIANNAIGDC